jgi:sugar O-acyltransferase (sialic acid O-acetyltransferase NeuD family)
MSRNATSNSVAVLGFHDGSAGQIETWFEKSTGYHIACFVHEATQFKVDGAAENRKRVSQRTEFPAGDTFKGRPFVVSPNWIEKLDQMRIRKVLPLTPNNRDRLRQIEACHAHGLELVSAIHPSVTILPEARIAPGVWINAGSIIGYKAEIEAGVLINTGVQIEHHNVLEPCCQIDPGVITAGYVTVRTCAHVHTGTVIINRMEIGEDAIVGAGAVVIESIPPRCTAAGVPAQVIRHHASRGERF